MRLYSAPVNVPPCLLVIDARRRQRRQRLSRPVGGLLVC
jgi:hypothetical protein